MEILLFAVLLGLIPAIARNKGRDFIPWWIYGSLLFIVALPHALLLNPEIKQVEQQQAAQGLKKCPFCAEMIKPDAKVCRYCGRDLPVPEPAPVIEPERPVPAPPVAQDVAWDDPSGGGGADREREQRRERLRAQLEEFRKKEQERKS